MKKHGFTLIELIVVITILAILGTIAFISFNGYSGQTRNAKITADMSSMHNALSLYKAKKGVVPVPDNLKIVKAGSVDITFEGEVGDNVRTLSKADNNMKMPDGTNYKYATNGTQKRFVLIGEIEEISTYLSKAYAESKEKIFKGDEVLTLFNSSGEFIGGDINASGGVSGLAKAYLGENELTVNSSKVESVPEAIKENKGAYFSSCKALQSTDKDAETGVYKLYLGGKVISAYCDMDTDGGGWTLLAGNSKKFGNNLPLNTTNPNLDNYNMGGDGLEDLIVDKGIKEYKYIIKRGVEDITVNIKSNIDTSKITLLDGETYLCFNDKDNRHDSSSGSYLHTDLRPTSSATYNGGNILYSERLNDRFRFRMFCDGNWGSRSFNHIKTYISGEAQHGIWDQYNLDGSRKGFGQFYITSGYLPSGVTVADFPTFGDTVKWSTSGTHYMFAKSVDRTTDESEDYRYGSPNLASDVGFTSYFMMR